MYYSYKCAVCGKVFYTFNDNKQIAAQILYNGIQTHIKDYKEDHSEYDFKEAPDREIYKMYYNAAETSEAPAGGYMLE
ncbi:hypothetical protein HYS00_00950 [Candidatus Microgenomates bacterium]|nr:hypothetical protein [Candidatus Microgenomates bacterium]